MNQRLRLIGLLVIAASSLLLGIGTPAGIEHFWLAFGLLAVFGASQGHYWDRSARELADRDSLVTLDDGVSVGAELDRNGRREPELLDDFRVDVEIFGHRLD